MARLTDIAVDLPARIEALLFLDCQRGDRRGHPRFAGPFNAPQDVASAHAESPPAAATAERAAGSRVRRTVRSGVHRQLPHCRSTHTRRRDRASTGTVGHGAFAIGGAPRRATPPGIGELSAATSAPRSNADRCQSLLPASPTEASTLRMASSCPPRTMVAASIVIAVSRCGVWSPLCSSFLEHDRFAAVETAQRCIDDHGIGGVSFEHRRGRKFTRSRRQDSQRRGKLLANRPVGIPGQLEHRNRHRVIRRPEPTLGDTDRGRAHVGRHVLERLHTVAGSMASRPSSVHSACSLVRGSAHFQRVSPAPARPDLAFALDQQPLRHVAPPAVRVRQRLDQLRRRRASRTGPGCRASSSRGRRGKSVPGRRCVQLARQDVIAQVHGGRRPVLDHAAIHVDDVERAVGSVGDVDRPEALVGGGQELGAIIRLARPDRRAVVAEYDPADEDSPPARRRKRSRTAPPAAGRRDRSTARTRR